MNQVPACLYNDLAGTQSTQFPNRSHLASWTWVIRWSFRILQNTPVGLFAAISLK